MLCLSHFEFLYALCTKRNIKLNCPGKNREIFLLKYFRVTWSASSKGPLKPINNILLVISSRHDITWESLLRSSHTLTTLILQLNSFQLSQSFSSLSKCFGNRYLNDGHQLHVTFYGLLKKAWFSLLFMEKMCRAFNSAGIYLWKE